MYNKNYFLFLLHLFATIPSNNKEGVDNPIMCDTGDCDPKPPLTDMCLTAGHSLHLRE